MKTITTSLILIVASLLFSQFRGTENSIDPRIKLMSTNGSSIFDMSRISVDHSLSMSYYTVGKNSVMLNEYVAGIKYRISDPLTLKLNMGLSYTPYSSFGLQEQNTADIYLKSASLDYRPNDSFRMKIDFRNIRPNDYLFNTYSDPFNDNEE